MVWAGGVLAGGHDREVDLLVALGEDPRRQVGRHLRPRCVRRAGCDRLGARRRSGRRRHRRPPARRSLPGPSPSAAGRRRRPPAGTRAPGSCGSSSTRKRAHIWSPTASMRATGRRARATIAVGSSVSPQGSSSNTPGCSTTRGASSRRDHHRRIAIDGHDQHRQPLERHRLIAGEIRQVVTHRQQQCVDSLVGHRLAHSCRVGRDRSASHRERNGAQPSVPWVSASADRARLPTACRPAPGETAPASSAAGRRSGPRATRPAGWCRHRDRGARRRGPGRAVRP